MLFMFTLDILYIHYNLSFAIRAAKAAAKVKKGVHRHHKCMSFSYISEKNCF